MLKIYHACYVVSVDNEPYKPINIDGYVMREARMPTEETILDNATFSDIISKQECLFGTYWCTTTFKKTPIVEIYYKDCTVAYKHFDTISYKRIYKEVTGMSLATILKTFPAEQTIQYLKEHGLNTCPIIKE